MERSIPPNAEIPPERREHILAKLVDWYRVHRRDLPWRGASPYAVWVSEVMLQQTQVATVIPYYLRFMERFPDVETLAAAPIDEALKYWAGLGYYARARNLHRGAKLVAERHYGRVPSTPEEIEALPGIGRYTSGAILSMAYSVPRPIVDGNVIRVLSRLFGLRGDPKCATNRNAFWRWAEQLVPRVDPGDFNQALMELGALVCLPADPRCDRCPLLSLCAAGNSADPTALPEIPPNRATVTPTHSSVLIHDLCGRVLIVQRPPHGLWGGLWEFPRAVCQSGETPGCAAARAADEVTGLKVEIGRRLCKLKHTVTHHRITLYGFTARPSAMEKMEAEAPLAREGAVLRWEPPEALADYPFSSPQALLRQALLTCGTGSACAAERPPSLHFEDATEPDI